MNEFVEFPKLHRLSKLTAYITEKIDGTNAQVFIGEDGSIRAGSRNRWLAPEADNFGFAAWVQLHREELRSLGPGRHYGEWWGQGIQRRYGLDRKCFSLFDTRLAGACAVAGVVPLLWSGPADSMFEYTAKALEQLRTTGSVAAPGFMKPEGVVIYIPGVGGFKRTLEKDNLHKFEAQT